MDARLEHIFEVWFDYEYSTDEDAKAHNKVKRSELIFTVLREAKVPAAVGDFLHQYRDDYRNWAVRKLLKSPRKRF